MRARHHEDARAGVAIRSRCIQLDDGFLGAVGGVALRLEHDAGTVVEGVILSLQAQVERIVDRGEVRLSAVRRERASCAVHANPEHPFVGIVDEIAHGNAGREEAGSAARRIIDHHHPASRAGVSFAEGYPGLIATHADEGRVSEGE